ncbi:hypothetical protein BKA70DRAFT_1313848 [Coprinopsis sp. MPI-PUGE-AT-0042]|nr:hypothetical protein BKA70DRAFT_1313848 [Coprinopsis sp. MPI-PUGE-AT-0042]
MARASRTPLPMELVSIIASFVAESGHAIRNPAVVACRLVCSTFAVVFRPLLFEFLHISNEGSEQIYRMLECRLFILLKNPEYALLVKRVTISFTTNRQERALALGQFMGNHPAFAELLNHLSCVSSLHLESTSPGDSFSFSNLSATSRDAIQRICSLTSLTTLGIAEWFDLPVPFLTSLKPTNLKDIRFYYSASYEFPASLEAGLAEAIRAPVEQQISPTVVGSPIHLSFSHRWPQMVALKSLGPRITHISGLGTFLLVHGRLRQLFNGCPSLQILDLTFTDMAGISWARLDLSMCKQMSALKICFQRAEWHEFPHISQFISDIVSSCGQGMRSIEVTFKFVTDWMEMSGSMETLDQPFTVPGRFPKLEVVHLLFQFLDSGVDGAIPSVLTQNLLPSVPSQKRKITVITP